MVDEVLTQEDQEIDALVALIDEDVATKQEHPYPLSDYGSDDEEYDRILMEALASADFRSKEDHPHREATVDPSEAMDLSSD